MKLDGGTTFLGYALLSYWTYPLQHSESGVRCKANCKGRLHLRRSKIKISINFNSDVLANRQIRNKSYSSVSLA
jgi:hypothetical protein